VVHWYTASPLQATSQHISTKALTNMNTFVLLVLASEELLLEPAERLLSATKDAYKSSVVRQKQWRYVLVTAML
jgi:hypothetical protein